jgi:aminopeptidase N
MALKDLLGDDMFRKCLHGYMDRWHGKHPVPWDFFYSFNNISGENLNWFWNAWFFGNNYIDLALEDIRKAGESYRFGIRNIGGFPVPVDLQLNFTDGSSQTVHRSPAIWKQNQNQASITVSSSKLLHSASLVTDIFVDADESNNTAAYK